MLNKQKIRKLAIISSGYANVPKDIEKFVLTQMSKVELKEFLRVLRIELDKKKVYVVSSEKLNTDVIKSLKNYYSEKEIVATLDESLGGGLVIKNNDLVIDFSFKKYINDTLEKIRN